MNITPGFGIILVMKILYYIRHGQTVWNVENKICGATDVPLTELGHKQAVETGEEFLRLGYKADIILHSPLMRAADTARHISDVTGIPAFQEERLREQNFGSFESKPRNGEEFAIAKRRFVYSFGGGESMLRVAQRVYNLLDELKERPETCVLVAHNGIARMVQSYFNEMTNEEFSIFGIKNCQIVEYHF